MRARVGTTSPTSMPTFAVMAVVQPGAAEWIDMIDPDAAEVR
jgi:hypothetical protein